MKLEEHVVNVNTSDITLINQMYSIYEDSDILPYLDSRPIRSILTAVLNDESYIVTTFTKAHSNELSVGTTNERPTIDIQTFVDTFTLNTVYKL